MPRVTNLDIVHQESITGAASAVKLTHAGEAFSTALHTIGLYNRRNDVGPWKPGDYFVTEVIVRRARNEPVYEAGPVPGVMF